MAEGLRLRSISAKLGWTPGRSILAYIKKIVVRFLAAVGAISLLCLSGYLVIPKLASAPSPPASHLLPSPNGKYKAVLLIDAGGGMGNYYCSTKVLIMPDAVDEQEAASEPNRYHRDEGRYEVYSAQCNSFHDHSESPKLKWLSDDSLEIAFSIDSTALFAEAFRLKKVDDSRQVNIRYVIEHDPMPHQ